MTEDSAASIEVIAAFAPATVEMSREDTAVPVNDAAAVAMLPALAAAAPPMVMPELEVLVTVIVLRVVAAVRPLEAAVSVPRCWGCDGRKQTAAIPQTAGATGT